MDLTLTRSLYQYPKPCSIGDSLNIIETPALFVREQVIKDNLELMSTTMKSKYPKVALRPHMKAHKCPGIAKMQIEHGAVGVCCQTLTETEAAILDSGCSDVLLSNQVIGPKKITRLCNLLLKTNELAVCVDNADNVEMINYTMQKIYNGEKVLDLVVEVDVGQKRCGVRPGDEVADLADLINSLTSVRFKGIQCYQGLNQHIRSHADRKVAVDKVVQFAKQSLSALSCKGINCDYVTGGGTGTFHYEAKSQVFTEVQPGSYIFMDCDYNMNLAEEKVGGFELDFKQSLFVLTSVQSVTEGSHATLDAGMKAVSLDSGVPQVVGRSDLMYTCAGDEHGSLNTSGNLKVGDVLQLVPGHCDPTVNLYDWLIFVDDQDVVTRLEKISARNPGV